MKSSPRARRDDQGYVLLLALGFVTFVGVIAVALVSYTTTNLRATVNLRQLRSEQFAADGAVDGAINVVRNHTSPATANCFGATLNQLSIRVDCSGPLPDVTFTACPAGVGACTPSSAVLVAQVTIAAGGTVTVNFLECSKVTGHSGHRRSVGSSSRARPEDGFTLTELLVVVSISSIIMAAIASAFIVGARTEADAYTRLQESHDGQLATAYFVADASNARYFSASATPPGSNCPDFGTQDVALFEWMDNGTSPPTKKDAFYGVSGSPSQLIRRYCEGDAFQYDVSLAKNLSTDPTKTPVITCPSPATSCTNVPAAVQLQVWETSGYSYLLRASPRSIAAVYPVGTFQSLIGNGGLTLTNSILKTNGYIVVNSAATCQGATFSSANFEVQPPGPNSGCGLTTPWSSLPDQFPAPGRMPPALPASFAAAPSSPSTCGSSGMTYQPGKYAPSTLGPGCLASGTYYLTGNTTLSHLTSAAGGVLIYVATGNLTLDTVTLGPLPGGSGNYPLTIYMDRNDVGTISASGTTDTVNGALYALLGTLNLRNTNFRSDQGAEVNAFIAVNSIVS